MTLLTTLQVQISAKQIKTKEKTVKNEVRISQIIHIRVNLKGAEEPLN